MKAIVVNEFDSTKKLIQKEIPIPNIKNTEVLVQVKAISINPVDVKTLKGNGIWNRLNKEKLIILGWDISGIIIQIGNDVTDFELGDEVFGMVNFPGHGQGYAEFVAVPANQLALKPVNCSHEEAASSTLAALTAYQGLTKHYSIKQGDKILVHGASGGVGHFVVQLAKYFGAYVIGVSSGVNKQFVLSLGADEHIDYTNVNFEDVVSNVDLVFDTVAGEYTERSLEVIKSGGTLISIPTGLNETITTKARSKKIESKFILVASNGNDMEAISNLLEINAIKPHIQTIYSFDDIEKAHLHIESGRTVGKVVITL